MQIQPVQGRIAHHQRQPTAFLDRRRAQRTVTIHAAHDQADDVAILVVRHRDEKAVDQAMVAFAIQRPQTQAAFFQRDQGIGRRQIEPAWLQAVAVTRRHQLLGLGAKQVAQPRFIQQRAVAQQQHHRQVGPVADGLQQLGQPRGIQPGGANAQNEKGAMHSGVAVDVAANWGIGHESRISQRQLAAIERR